MRLKFLGTSAGWPLPRLGCSCGICTSTDPHDRRTRTQILIDDSVLLDAGPDTYTHLNSLDSIASLQNDKGRSIVHKLKAILISHEHPDHTLGLWDLPHIYGRSEDNLDKIQLYITQPVLNGIRGILPHFFGQIKPVIVKPNQTFEINNAKATYFPVIHGKTPAFGVKFLPAGRQGKNGKFLAYIPDFNKILPTSQKVIRDPHLLLIDGSSLGKIGQGPGHISIEQGIELAKKLRAQKTYFIHIGHKTGTHQFLEDYLRKNAGPNFHISHDGLELTI